MRASGRSTPRNDKTHAVLLQDPKGFTMTQEKFTLEIHQPYSTFTDGHLFASRGHICDSDSTLVQKNNGLCFLCAS